MSGADPGPDVDQQGDSGEFDAQAFMRQLQQATARAELVASKRPGGQALSDSLATAMAWLYDFVQTTRSIAHLELGEDPGEAWSWAAKSSSVAESDGAWVADLTNQFCERQSPGTLLFAETNPDRNTATWGLDFVARCFHTAMDHLTAVSVLVSTENALRAPITLSRTVLEAAATACFIIDTSVSREERLRRTLNLRFSEMKESANERAADSDASDEQSEITELITFASTAGFTVAKYERRGHQPPIIFGGGRRRADSARLIVDQVLPSGVGLTMYRSMSAVAHSRESVVLLPDKYSLPHEVKAWRRVESIAWHVVPALLVARELCLRLQAFLGWDLADAADLLESVAAQWSVGAGLHDKAIRADLGLD